MKYYYAQTETEANELLTELKKQGKMGIVLGMRSNLWEIRVWNF